MEERTIQEIRGSYAIYLPRSWCISNNLRKGSKILVKDLSGKLIIEPSDMAHKPVEFNINIDAYTKDELRYIIISLYILGADYVKLESKRPIKPKIRSIVRDALRFLNGFEIFDMGKNYIVIKQSVPGIDIENQMYEAINKTRSMFSYIYESLKDEGRIDYDTLIDLSSIDDEIDRARNILERQLNKSLTTLNLPNNLNLRQLSFLVNIARISERIADHLYYIANLCIDKNRSCSLNIAETLRELQNIFEKLTIYIGVFLDHRESHMKGDSGENGSSLKLRDLVSIIEHKGEFHKSLERLSSGSSILIYHLGRIYDYLTDIAENLLDLTIGKHMEPY